MKIVVVGLGYVGLSNAVLLARYYEVIGVDISQERVDNLNARQSPIVDKEISEYLTCETLKFSASTELDSSVKDANYVIICTPTNYDQEKQYFDTSSVETVISQVIEAEPEACIIVKSTIPIGFIEDVTKRLKTNAVIFSPEFLREGKALYDNLFPSRIIVGEKSKRAEAFANLLAQCAIKSDVPILLTGSKEAEAIKLFSNTYLAMRVAFFNELDSYALAENFSSREIIEGVSLDPRIGNHYNNPSFGYGGYCLPKDTKQLLENYNNVPQNMIRAVVESNSTRKDFLADIIIKHRPKRVGVYRLAMKSGSDNFRDSSIIDIIERLLLRNIQVSIFEPELKGDDFKGLHVEKNLNALKNKCDLIIANRTHPELNDVQEKVFTRDIFSIN